ncbi:MAG: DUF134 domain-containing protein [Peptococcaceae bacterium]|nr:DUF134 domain-containing protein [Peptococcaceae bacterium]
MARPVKWRKVEHFPKETYFLPCPKGNCHRFEDVAEVELKIEELEAIRLKDIEGLTQEEGARRMEISRQTFQNVLDEARRKVATALVEGKAISVGGGHYTKNVCKLKCQNCGGEFDTSYEQREITCRKCGSMDITCSKKRCRTNCTDYTKD